MARFLVVDRDPSTVSALVRLLEGEGHDAMAFTEAPEAVAALYRQHFDVSIADVHASRGGGRVILEASRESHPAACRFAVTARVETEQGGLLEAGACAVLDKPVDYGTLSKLAGECLTAKANGGACPLLTRPQHERVMRGSLPPSWR